MASHPFHSHPLQPYISQVLGLLKNPTTPPQYPTNPSNLSLSLPWYPFHSFNASSSGSLASTTSKCSLKNTVIHACVSS